MRRFAVLLLTIAITLTTGCWGQREMDEIGIVTITGIDLEPDGMVRMTVHSVQPYGSRTNPPDRSFTWVGTALGDNIMDASKNLRGIATRKLVWLQSNIIIVGEELAKKEFENVLDYFSRNREIRYNSYVLATKGRAFDMMQVPADIAGNLADELKGIIMNVDDWSKSYASNIKEFLVSSSSPYSSNVTARVGYKTMNMDTFSDSREEHMELEPKKSADTRIPFIEGVAVFKNDRLVGWLNGSETRGYLWITGKVKPGVVLSGNFEGGYITAMENRSVKSIIRFTNDNGIPTIKVKLEVDGILVEHGSETEPEKKEDMKKIEEIFIQEIRSEMESAVEKTRQLNVDIFRFCREAYIASPELRENFGQEWDKIYPRLNVEYEIKVTIDRTGMILERIIGR